MSEHLSHDQITKWIVGQSTAEEEQHGLECPECSAALSRFRESVSTFRFAMKDWSEREIVPRLDEASGGLLRRHRSQPPLRWALVTMTAVLLMSIPVYEHMRKPATLTDSVTNLQAENAVTVVNDDVRLMEEVNVHLSRPLPMPMERVMALLPDGVEQLGLAQGAEGTEGKEIR